MRNMSFALTTTQVLEQTKDVTRRLGFPHLTPSEFVAMFCATHKGCTPDTVITRIEFVYTGPRQ